MSSSKKRKTGVATAEGRAIQFGSAVHVVDGVLFCTACSHSLPHDKVDTIKSHFKSNRHVLRASSHTHAPRQLPVLTSYNLRDEFSMDIVKLFAQANIPLYR
jgi:hypothetical protein